jgi:ankyrin repeat protein
MALMVKLLAEKGADSNGQTPLSRAAGSGREALATLQFTQT